MSASLFTKDKLVDIYKWNLYFLPKGRNNNKILLLHSAQLESFMQLEI